MKPTIKELQEREASGLPTVGWFRLDGNLRTRNLRDYCGRVCDGNSEIGAWAGEWLGWCGPPLTADERATVAEVTERLRIIRSNPKLRQSIAADKVESLIAIFDRIAPPVKG